MTIRIGYWLLTKWGKAQIYAIWPDESVTVEFEDATTRIIGSFATQRYRKAWLSRRHPPMAV